MKLLSGSELEITLAPFAEARDLYQALLKEVQGVDVKSTTELDVNFAKGMLCTILSSKEVEEKVWVCMKRATYNKNRITVETFEPEDARQDYFEVMKEVAMRNINPFLKSLSVEYGHILETVKASFQK